jgi:CheY-like chemotaxis protein
MLKRRYRVWLVDDREINRKEFLRDLGGGFDVTVFESPNAVLRALDTCERPDALLCDIYFYDDPEKREAIESRVEHNVKELQKLAAEFGTSEAQAGIDLIANVRAHFGEAPPFPIYAYTSKGPYLLQDNGFERLEELDARWLFKKKYSPQAVTHRIIRDVSEFRGRDWHRRIWRFVVVTGLISAILGAILGVVFDRLARYWFGY